LRVLRLMGDVEQTKLRLIREAVQNNVHHERRSRTQAGPAERSPRAAGWLGAAGVIATLAALPLLSPFVSSPGASMEGVASFALAASEDPASRSFADESMGTASTAAPEGPLDRDAPPEPLD